jgi:hypothetical protein
VPLKIPLSDVMDGRWAMRLLVLLLFVAWVSCATKDVKCGPEELLFCSDYQAQFRKAEKGAFFKGCTKQERTAMVDTFGRREQTIWKISCEFDPKLGRATEQTHNCEASCKKLAKDQGTPVPDSNGAVFKYEPFAINNVCSCAKLETHEKL